VDGQAQLALICTVVLLAAARGVSAAGRGVTNTWSSPHVRLRSVDLDDTRWTQGFWAQKHDLCRKAILPAVQRALSDRRNAAVLENFRVAAGLTRGPHRGTDWGDGDCYKWLEAVAHMYALTRDEALDRLLDEWISVIAKAQAGDGYLSTNIQLTPKGRLANPHHHELYNMGHLLTAACIHKRATGKDSFLRIARKLGDYLYRTFQPRPAKLAHFGWNPSNIMGLAELYRTTGDRKYLELAGIFVEMRGSAPGGSDLTQDHLPLRKETHAVGHCVCACYLYCGAADVCAETGDQPLREALERIWHDATTRRTYLTGAVGSFWRGKSLRGDAVHEAFGGDYELPSRTAYNETCANIGSAMWNWRMLALTGEAKYADAMERVLYNSMLSAVGVDGRDFFYCNPLRWDGERPGPSKHHTPRRWSLHDCYCCPPQVARTIAKLHNWAYSVSREGVWVNLYGGSVLDTKLPDGSPVKLTQKTGYPWDGRVRLTVQKAPSGPLALRLRIPGWVRRAAVRVNGSSARARVEPGTYLAVRRTWKPGDAVELDLPMPVRLMEAHPRVRSLRGKVGVVRGPVVYCLESRDLPSGVGLDDVAIPPGIVLTPRFGKDLLGGVTVLTGEAVRGRPRPAEQAPAADASWTNRLYSQREPAAPKEARGQGIDVMLIPYYAWANRGLSEMTVWMSLAR
jgi:DUF1680 family protein